MKKKPVEELIEACFLECLDKAKSLIENKPELLNQRTGLGETPLHFLCVENRLEGVKLLHQNGADLNSINEFGDSPVSEAVNLGHTEIVSYLFENGVLIDQSTEIGGYILHEAVRSGSLKMVELCVQYGANIHAKDSLNETPLHESTSDDNWIEITKYLIEHGADINAIGAFNVTPLHSALFSESKKTAKFLVKSGASLTIKDAKGRTPIQVAQEKNNPDLVTWFEEYIHKHKEP